MRILVVDDEEPARQRLIRLIEEIGGEFEVVGEAADGDQAVTEAVARDADLVLLDIRMPEVDGLEAADRLSELDPPPAVIFVTAYEGYALDAFERKVEDYLVKPVRRDRLEDALKRASVFTRAQLASQAVASGASPPANRRHHLSAHYRGGLQTVAISDIVYLLAEHKYVTVRHVEGSMLVDESLKALEQEFTDRFMRIHRNALVARECLVGLEKTSDGSSQVCLKGIEEHLPVSRRHLPDVRRFLRSG